MSLQSGSIDSDGLARTTDGKLYVTLGSGSTIDSPTFTGTSTQSGRELFASGTQAAPSIAWSADDDGTGTGFYRSAANEVAVTINGSLTTKFTSTQIQTFVDTAALVFGASLDTSLARGSAGVWKFANANSFSANGSVATALTSVGPTGSHTTVQTWLTIQDNSGTVRYIPCF